MKEWLKMLKELMEYTDEWDNLGSRKKWQRIHVTGRTLLLRL